MAKAFLFIFLGILPSYLLSENLERGFGTIVNDQNEPISFSSDSLFFNEKTGTSEMKGSVNISQGETSLSSNYAEISFSLDTNELERFYASGDVVLQSGADIAMGDEAVYDFIKNEITLLGDVYLSQAGSTVKAEKALINTKTGSASMTGSVKTTLTPPKKEGDVE